jgi:ABC-type Mn2+/Zn2+ transport system ATPase subunit
MLDFSRHLHFTHSLERFSLRLNELLASARQDQAALPPELLDEIAYTTGELTIVLMNHDGYQEEELIKEVLSLAQALRYHLRTNQLTGEKIIQAFNPFREKIDLLISVGKQAA